MKTVLIVIGKTTDRHLQALIADYSARISHYMPFTVDVIPELRATRALSPDEQKQREARLLLARFIDGDHIVLLDERGVEMRSTEFARWLACRHSASRRRLVFVVGGPYGFAPDVYRAADEQLSLSQLTYSHQLIRLLLVEQLYRACTILHRQPYHHE